MGTRVVGQQTPNGSDDTGRRVETPPQHQLNEGNKMQTYTEHQLRARVTDLEHALTEIVEYLDGLNPAGLVADYGHAYTAGSLEASTVWAKQRAQRALDFMS